MIRLGKVRVHGPSFQHRGATALSMEGAEGAEFQMPSGNGALLVLGGDDHDVVDPEEDGSIFNLSLFPVDNPLGRIKAEDLNAAVPPLALLLRYARQGDAEQETGKAAATFIVYSEKHARGIYCDVVAFLRKPTQEEEDSLSACTAGSEAANIYHLYGPVRGDV